MQTTSHSGTRKYLIVIQKSHNNYGAYSPDVLGCVATGKTIEKTIENMTSALEFHLQGMAAEGETIPLAQGLAHHLNQTESIAASEDIITHVLVNLPQAEFSLNNTEQAV
jgi:predicted RNase H-like HicB family nuclease